VKINFSSTYFQKVKYNSNEFATSRKRKLNVRSM
jgi:hypothetical protein